MANASKRKGDEGEREAVTFIVSAVPDLVNVHKAQRALGAGRKEDTGDLHIFTDTAIQVRRLKAADIGLAIRSSARDSVIQAGHGGVPHALGMAPIHNARLNSVRWLACVTPGHWPIPVEPVAEFSMVGKAVAWARDDLGPTGYTAWDRTSRVGLLAGPGHPALIAPMEAWLAAYRIARNEPALLAA